jgi:hypothetical protein
VPEGLEAEIWRTALDVTVGRIITDAWVDERVAPADFADLVVGQRYGASARSISSTPMVPRSGCTSA